MRLVVDIYFRVQETMGTPLEVGDHADALPAAKAFV